MVNVNVIVSAVDSQLVNESTGASREFYLPRQIASSRRCTVSRAELDSHADTCVVGKHCLVIRDWDRPVDVYGWNPKDGKRVCQTVTAVVSYVRPDNGQLVNLVIHQAIHCPHLDHHLLSPFQLRCNGIIVNETQKLFVDDPSQVDHVLICKEEDGERLVVPLIIHRVTSYFPCREPSRAEWEDDQILQVELTSETTPWDPDNEDFAQMEEALLDQASAKIADKSPARGRLVGINQVSHHCCAVDVVRDELLGLALEDNLRVSSSELGQDPAFWLRD